MVQISFLFILIHIILHCASGLSAVKPGTAFSSVQDALSVVDKCSIDGKTSDHLYEAVRYLDKQALKLDEEEKEKLWKTAHGSWKLQLATGGGKFFTFKPVPIFAFAYLDDVNFGNGVGFNQDFILLSLLGPHEYNTKRRQMVINIDDMFICGNKITDVVPVFIQKGIGLGMRPADYKAKSSRPQAFTFIASSKNSLVARGGSGGIAIWTRLNKSICPSAYNAVEDS